MFRQYRWSERSLLRAKLPLRHTSSALITTVGVQVLFKTGAQSNAIESGF